MNYVGYPINPKYAKFYSKNELDFLYDKLCDNCYFEITNSQREMFIHINEILQKEIDEWEWETIMDYPKEKYNEVMDAMRKQFYY